MAAALDFAAGSSVEWWQWLSLLVDDGGRRLFYWEFNFYIGTVAGVPASCAWASATSADWRWRRWPAS